MRISRTRALPALALAGVAVLALAPALGQDRPESILPPGFGDPAPAPTARATSRPAAPTGALKPPTSASGQSATPAPAPAPTPSPTPSATPTPVPIDPAVLARYEMPPFARRSLALVGPAGPAEGALAADAFGAGDGPFLETLMRRLSAPLPSRWMSILLRRTLAARLATPRGVGGADFAAERAWLLLRMGEADAARAVVQGVDTGNYTPKLYQVALNALLAAGDPAGLCPLADGGAAATGEAGWTMAQAMCAGLAGEPQRANALLKVAARRRTAAGVDLQLAQKVVGSGANGRQAVTIEWAGVDRLTPWRFGLATATGVAVPDDLIAAVGPQVRYWRALSPAVPIAARIAAADAAAAQGVLSNAALVDLYGAAAADDSAASADAATADDLRSAYAERNPAARLAAIRQLWGADAARVPYARLVLTAHAAAQLPVKADVAEADRLVASMLSAGLDRSAARWRAAVAPGGDGWALILLADPDVQARIAYGELADYAGTGDAALKQRLFFAGMAGLGRLAPGDVERAAEALDVRIGTQNSWTRALDRAAERGEQGTVVLLCAVGLQTGSWRGVPPEALYRMVGALRAVGLGGEARMVAAEAIARA